MNRRQMLLSALGLAAWHALARRLPAVESTPGDPPHGDFEPIDKPLSEWREILPSDRFHILFEEGTEPPGSSPLNDEKRPGLFLCAACHLPLFDAATKYDSGTGWPSFWDVLEGRVETETDLRIGYPRTEYHCARCGGHQGHVFEDGPEPTGLRYCNNGLALEFVPEGEELPPLRG